MFYIYIIYKFILRNVYSFCNILILIFLLFLYIIYFDFSNNRLRIYVKIFDIIEHRTCLCVSVYDYWNSRNKNSHIEEFESITWVKICWITEDLQSIHLILLITLIIKLGDISSRLNTYSTGYIKFFIYL